MKLIIGGYAQGRLAYTLQKYHLTEKDVWDVMHSDTWQGQKIIYHTEELVTKWLNAGKNITQEMKKLIPEWEHAILITQEVGCGLVPVSAEQRQWREEVGRMNQLLAENADTVERICCGLGMYLKQES